MSPDTRQPFNDSVYVKGGTALHTKAAVITCLLLFGLAGTTATAAQRPRISPHERVSAVVESAAIAIDYGRPSMRGRAIMGRLVPYGDVWCPGADEATQLTTSKALRIGNLSLKPGSYTLWMLPAANDWTLVVSSAVDVFHTQYSSRYDLGRVAMARARIDEPVEQLTFSIEGNAPGAGGTIVMTWETTRVSVPFSVVQ